MQTLGDGTNSLSRHRTTLQKVVETGFLSATWLALGLYLEIFGPTLIDLKIKTNSNYEDVAVAVSGRSVGLFIGGVFGGVMVDKFGHFCHVLIAVSLDVAAIATVIAPWSPGPEVLWVCCAVGGTVETVINVAGQRLILNMWKEKSASPMHLLHMGYGIGSFIVPLYSNPFLAVPMPTAVPNLTYTTIDYSDTTTILNDIYNHTDTAIMNDSNRSLSVEPVRYLKESRIEYAYAISAALVALMSIVFYSYQIQENIWRSKQKRFFASQNDHEHKPGERNLNRRDSGGIQSRSFREMFNPATCSGGRLWYSIQLLVILFVFFGNANGGERLIGGFIRSFSVDQLGFASAEASYLNTSFWISFTMGRFIFFIAARWIGIRKLILIETCGITLTAIFMTIFAVDHTMAYWVLLQSLGIFEAPLWPSMMAWTDYHMELTGVATTVFLFAGAIGGIIHLRLIGYLYEHLGPRTFLYQLLGYGVLALSLAIILTLVGAQHGSRFKWKRSEYEYEYAVENDQPVTGELLRKSSDEETSQSVKDSNL